MEASVAACLWSLSTHFVSHEAWSLQQPLCSTGKVVDVQRATTAGFARGQLLLEGDSSLSTSSAGGNSGGSTNASGLRKRLRIRFQNENLVAEEADEGQEGAAGGQWAAVHRTAAVGAAASSSSGSGTGGATSEGSGGGARVLASVPDLICCIEEDSEWHEHAFMQCCTHASLQDVVVGEPAGGGSTCMAAPAKLWLLHLSLSRLVAHCHCRCRCLPTFAAGQPIATEEMRYGLRVAVVVLPAHPLLTTPQALAVVGPAAFGHAEVAYVPLGRYAEPGSIPR